VIVKICGLSNEEDTRAALAAGANAVGFVLAPSPRQVTLERARELLALVPNDVESVAVFAEAQRDEIEAACEAGFSAVQAEVGSPLEKLPHDTFAIPVLRDGDDLEQRLDGLETPAPMHASLCGTFVLDGPGGGGRGIPVDLERARLAARKRRMVLAGGLHADNVAERIHAIAPYAVDTSSGVERERGIKDPERIHAFVRAARQAFGEKGR